MTSLRTYSQLPAEQREALFEVLFRTPEIFWDIIDDLEAKSEALAAGASGKVREAVSTERDRIDILLTKASID